MANDKIELRSEKVRRIIGEIPSRIVRYGITTITIVVLGLLAGACFIPYPETVSAKVQMTNNNHIANTQTNGSRQRVHCKGKNNGL